MLTLRLAPIVLALCVLTTVAQAQNNLSLETRQATPGRTDVRLLVTLDHTEAAGVGGFSFGLDHDDLVLTVTDLVYAGPPVVEASFVLVDIDTSFATIGVILFDGIGGLTLLPPGSYLAAEATYDVAPGATPGLSPIAFATVGAPPIAVEYSTPGGPVVPTTTSGGVEVLGAPQAGAVALSQLWIPNSGATTVSVINSTTSTVLDTPDGAPSATPNAVAVGRNGVVWTTYSGSSEVVRFDSNTGAPFPLTTAASRISVGAAPSAIAIDPFDNAWVANRTDHTLTKISAAGEVLLGAGGLSGGPVAVPGGTLLRGIASDSLGNIWVASEDGNALHKYNNAGELAFTLDLGAGASPYGVAVDRAGFVWVALAGLDEVRRYANDGTLSEPGYPLAGASPTAIAIRGQRTAWIAGSGNGMLYSVEPGVGAAPVISTFTGVTSPSGIAIASDGSIWMSNSTGGSVQEFDEFGTAIGAPVTVGASPEFLGDASGYILANVLFPTADFDLDTIQNSSETDMASNPFDGASVPMVAPVEDLVCTAVYTGVGTDFTVTLTWTIPAGASYSMIEIFRDGISQGTTALPTDTSFMQTVSAAGDYLYTVTASMFFPTADAFCGVTVGTGDFVDDHPVGVGDPATNLQDITANPIALSGQPTFYVTETGTNQILALDDDYNETGTIPSPFAPGLPLSGVALAPCSICGNGGQLWVATGGDNQQVMVHELEYDGTPIGLPRALNDHTGAPLIGRVGGLAAIEDADNLGEIILLASLPTNCDLFGFRISVSDNALLGLSAVHPNAGPGSFGLNGVAYAASSGIRAGTQFGSATGGGGVQLMSQDPAMNGTFEVIEYTLTPGAGSGGMALLMPTMNVDTIPLDGVPGETVFGGFVTQDGSMSVAGVATSVVYELDLGFDFIRGDANFDDSVNIGDAVSILAFLFGGDPLAFPNCEIALDTNGDGTINIADAVYLLTHLFNNGPRHRLRTRIQASTLRARSRAPATTPS